MNVVVHKITNAQQKMDRFEKLNILSNLIIKHCPKLLLIFMGFVDHVRSVNLK